MVFSRPGASLRRNSPSSLRSSSKPATSFRSSLLSLFLSRAERSTSIGHAHVMNKGKAGNYVLLSATWSIMALLSSSLWYVIALAPSFMIECQRCGVVMMPYVLEMAGHRMLLESLGKILPPGLSFSPLPAWQGFEVQRRESRHRVRIRLPGTPSLHEQGRPSVDLQLCRSVPAWPLCLLRFWNARALLHHGPIVRASKLATFHSLLRPNRIVAVAEAHVSPEHLASSFHLDPDYQSWISPCEPSSAGGIIVVKGPGAVPLDVHVDRTLAWTYCVHKCLCAR